MAWKIIWTYAAIRQRPASAISPADAASNHVPGSGTAASTMKSN